MLTPHGLATTDPLDGPTPPPVVARFSDPEGRTAIALRAPVWHAGSWCTCLDRTLAPGMGLLAPHRHDDTEETHFVRQGEVRYLQGVRVRRARPGDVIRTGAGTPHMDPWATRAGEVLLTTLLRPAAPAWLRFGQLLGQAVREGQLTRTAQMPLPQLMRAVHASGADVYAAGLPSGLQRTVSTPALARLADLRAA